MLKPGGLLCIGHAESLTDIRELFQPCGKTSYVRR
jgi:hypothetical protein